MQAYKGEIIEESLISRDILDTLKIVSSRVSLVTPEHATPWLKQWTLHTVEVPETQVKAVANNISRLLDPKHGASWYADFKNDVNHYIIYINKVFFINRQDISQYLEAKNYGLNLGIPEHQVNFEELLVKSK